MPFAKTRDVLLRGTRAAQMAAASVQEGSLYYVSDEGVTEQSTGAAWVSYGAGGAGQAGVIGPAGPVGDAGDDGETWLIPGPVGPTGATGSAGGATVSTTAFGSEPGAPSSGDLDLYTNSPYVGRYSGSAWAPWAPLFAMTPPVDGDFSWVNQGGASVDTSLGGIHLLCPATAGVAWRLRMKAAPATPYTITAAFLSNVITANFMQFALVFRQSSDGRLAVNSMQWSGRYQIASLKYSSPTVLSAAYTSNIPATTLGLTWLRIADDGASRILSASGDGQRWIVYHSVGRTDYLTADEVGFGAMPQNSSYDFGVTLLSWVQA